MLSARSGSFWNGAKGYKPPSRAADRTASQLSSIHICFPEQGGNMAITMSWRFSDFRHLSCFTLLIKKLASITAIYSCCIYSIVVQINAGFPFPLTRLGLRLNYASKRVPRTIFQQIPFPNIMRVCWVKRTSSLKLSQPCRCVKYQTQ